MNGDQILARLERLSRFIAQAVLDVVGGEAAQTGGAQAVDVDLARFVVMQQQLGVVDGIRRDLDLASQPDIGRVPRRVDGRVGRARGAEAALTCLPL